MEGKTTWIIAGVLGLVLLYFVFRGEGFGTVSLISKTPPPTNRDKIDQLASELGGAGGRVTAQLLGAPAPVAGAFASVGSSYFTGTVAGFRKAGTGVTQLAHGDVIGGATSIATGAAQTAYTATGAKGIVDLARSIF